MTKYAKYRLFHPFAALGLLQLLIVVQCQSVANQKLKPNQSKPTRSTEPSMLLFENAQLSTRNILKRMDHVGKTDDPGKFHVGIARAVRQHHTSSEPTGIERHDQALANSESWHGHSLTPTPNDREQGEEIVALASEPDQDELRPHANKSVPSKEQKIAETNSNKATGSSAAEPGKYRLQSNQDEYENEEDEEDDEAGHVSLRDYESNARSNHDRKESTMDDMKFKPLHQSKIQYTDFVVQHPAKSPNLDQPFALNHSAPARDLEWPPRVRPNNHQQQLQPQQYQPQPQQYQPQPQQYQQQQQQYQPQQHQQQQQHHIQETQDPSNKPDIVKVAKTSLAGERLVSLLDGREGLTKVDVAIEYLRNILKTKKNQTVTDQKEERNQNQARISILASKLDKISNGTMNHNNISQTSADKSFALPAAHSPQPLASDLMHMKQDYQPESKFSISDAKSTTIMDQLYRQQQIYASTSAEPPISGELMYSKPPFQKINLSENMQIYRDNPSTIPSNGSPLGADYMEGLVEYPRFVNSPLKTQHHALLESQSQLVPAKLEYQNDQKINLNEFKQMKASSMEQQDHQVSSEGFLPPQRPAEELRVTRFPQASNQARANEESRLASVKKITTQQNTDLDSMRTKQELPAYLINSKSTQGRPSLNEIANATEPSFPFNNMKIDELKSNLATSTRSARADSMNSVLQTPSGSQLHHNPKVSISSSKIYGNDEAAFTNQRNHQLFTKPQDEAQPPNNQAQPKLPQNTKVKPPRIVSYNYFEGPSDINDGEMVATNYQLADTLYSSTGGVEQMLSNAELEAIQSQFMTAEHPIVPIPANDQQALRSHQDQSLSGLLANLKPEDYSPDSLQKLFRTSKQAGDDSFKELASEQSTRTVAPSPQMLHPSVGYSSAAITEEQRKPQNKPSDFDDRKRKSLIVYLNHPRSKDMSKNAISNDGYNLAQSISDQPSESLISAKEFDSHGLSKDTKHLDVSNLRGFNGDSSESQDKDGLSVVVIGDAYKYKKIVLLISSKSGGLKFIPMVKDMKK